MHPADVVSVKVRSVLYRILVTITGSRKLMPRKIKPYKNGRDRYLQDTYGITAEQWQKMFDRQDGKCPICLTKLYGYKEKGGRRAACVDHDHKTGRVRGLLNFHCNKYKVSNNTAETAKRMLQYLESDFDGRKI